MVAAFLVIIGTGPNSGRHPWKAAYGRHPSWKAAGVQKEPNPASSIQHLTPQIWLQTRPSNVIEKL